MQVILNFSDEELKHIKEITSVHNQSIEEVLMQAFYMFIYEPSSKLGEIIIDGREQDFRKFMELFGRYMHESIEDIHTSSTDPETAYPTDKAMVHVYRKLLHDKFPVVYNSVELYETFYKHYKKPLK